MESKKINQLATELAPDLTDLTIIGDPITGISKKITLSQMASLFTGTVEEYENKAAFPLVGVADTIYVALDTNVIWRWNTGTSAYVELSPNIINSLVFGDGSGFDGTISLVGSVATLTITTALTTGSVGFIGASGALLEDNTNFFWNNTNKRLGIGTNTPGAKLDIHGTGTIVQINGTTTNNAFISFQNAGVNKWTIGNVQADHRFRIYSEANSTELVSVLQTGEFGIGIANPLTKFHIFGGASALIANLDANVSVAKSISYRSGNSSRINLEVSGTESGTNAGMDFFLRTYADAGSLLETPFSIVRSTGVTTIKSLTLTNALSILNGGTGSTTKNFVDLTTAQTVAGIKTFSSKFLVSTSVADYATYILQTGGVDATYGGLKVETSSTSAKVLSLYNAGSELMFLRGDGVSQFNGQMNGTSAIFSGGVQAANMSIGIALQTDKLFIYNASGTNTGLTIQQDGTGDIFRANGNSGTNRFSITQAGVATFSNSITSTQLITKSGSGAAALFLKDGSAVNKWEIGHISNALYFYSYTSNSEVLRLSSSGALIVKSNDGSETMSVYTNISSTNFAFSIGGSGSINGIATGASSAATIMRMNKDSGSGRSLNAAGSLNASGADYAEYILKAVNDIIYKGDICGINANGQLTNIYSDSVSFVVKSTNPSYVGNDIWGNEDIVGKMPMEEDYEDKEQYVLDLTKFKAKVEVERTKVDRVAFSGQVPCNILNTNVGDYIIPIKQSNGKIAGKAVQNPTLEEYQISVGKVWKIMEDGRAWIAVKIG
jgi:hypothetical protein